MSLGCQIIKQIRFCTDLSIGCVSKSLDPQYGIMISTIGVSGYHVHGVHRFGYTPHHNVTTHPTIPFHHCNQATGFANALEVNNTKLEHGKLCSNRPYRTEQATKMTNRILCGRKDPPCTMSSVWTTRSRYSRETNRIRSANSFSNRCWRSSRKTYWGRFKPIMRKLRWLFPIATSILSRCISLIWNLKSHRLLLNMAVRRQKNIWEPRVVRKSLK